MNTKILELNKKVEPYKKDIELHEENHGPLAL